MRSRLNDDALQAYARFSVETGSPGPAKALVTLREAGFSASRARMDLAWQRAVTIQTFRLNVHVALPGRHPWATDPPKRLVVLDAEPHGQVNLETTVVVVSRGTSYATSAVYHGEPEVNS